jgi:hypothetical protein
MKAKRTAIGVALAAAAVVGGRYGRDLRRARVRLARLARRSTNTPFGPLEYCEWGEGETPPAQRRWRRKVAGVSPA